MNISRGLLYLVFGATIAGCTNQSASTTGAGSAPTPPVSFDGRYDGSIQITGVASGGSQQQCATAPQISLQVANNSFTYVQSHPNIANTAPGVTAQNTAATYSATISADGSISGDSGDLGGTIQGRVSGTHMSGTINGLLCFYDFKADRT
jgi:hypothetical protein